MKHTTLLGLDLDFQHPLEQKLEKFYERILTSESGQKADDLLYGEANPLAPAERLEGQVFWTGEQLRDPAWAYLGDAVARVRARCGELDTAAVIAAATWGVPEAARSLGVSENAVRAAIASGDLPSVVVAGRHMLDRRAVEAHVSTGTRAGKTERVPALYARVGTVPGGANLVVAVLDAEGHQVDGELLQSRDGVDELVWSSWAEAVILWGKGDKARAVRIRPAHGRVTTKIEFAGLSACGRWDVLDQTNNRRQSAELLGRISSRAKSRG